MSQVLKAEKLLKDADLVRSNNEISADKIAAAYDKSIKVAPKGDSLIARAYASKATMYFLKANRAESKLKSKLMQKALKASTEAIKDQTCLLGIYVDAKIRLKLGLASEAEIAPYIRKVKETIATTWEDHFAQVKCIDFDEGEISAIAKLAEIVKMDGFKDDFRAHQMLAGYAMKQGQFELAAQHFKVAVDIDHRLINVFYDLAECYDVLANVDDQETRISYLQKEREALYGYKKARADSKFKEDAVGIGNLCANLRELEEYEEYFQESAKAVKLFGKKAAWPHISLGTAYSYKKYESEKERVQYEKLARAEFVKAHKLKSGSPYTTVSEANMLANFGKITEAIQKLSDAQVLMLRHEAQSEAEEFPEVQHFVKTMLEEGRQGLIDRVKALGEQQDTDAISLGEVEDELSTALREDYNAQVERSNEKAHQLVRAGINAVRDGTKVEQITSEAEMQYSYRTELSSGKTAVFNLEKGIAALRADSNETAYGYFLGFFQTLRAAYASATLAADDKFSLDLSNPVSKASSLLTLLPFGGDIAASVVGGVAEMVVKEKVISPMKTLYGVCTDFEFGPMMGRVALKVTYAKKAYLEQQKPKVTTRFEKFKAALKKLVQNGAEEKFYPTPEEFEGHKDAVEVLKNIYQGEKGQLSAKPRANFEERLEKFSLQHLVGDYADESGLQFISSIESALSGCADTIQE